MALILYFSWSDWQKRYSSCALAIDKQHFWHKA